MPTIETTKQEFLARLKQLHDSKIITGGEIVDFLATHCGEGATPDEITAVGHELCQDCEDQAEVEDA